MFFSGTDAQQGLEGPNKSGEHGLVYGEVTESIEIQPIQNPYYDTDIEISGMPEKVTSSPDANDIETVTATKNIYYDI